MFNTIDQAREYMEHIMLNNNMISVNEDTITNGAITITIAKTTGYYLYYTGKEDHMRHIHDAGRVCDINDYISYVHCGF